MSAIGTKRTCRVALHISAYDPKRTLHLTEWRDGSRTSQKREQGYFVIPLISSRSVVSHQRRPSKGDSISV